MKKFFFALACVIGLMTFASCDPEVMQEAMEQKPVLELVDAEGCITHNLGVRIGDSLFFEVKAAPNSSSLSELSNLELSIYKNVNTLISNESFEFEDPNEENLFLYSYLPEDEEAEYTFKFTLTDKASKTNEVTVIVACFEPVEPENGLYIGTMDLSGEVSSNEIAGHETYDHEVFEFEGINVAIALGETNSEGLVHIGVDIEDTYLSFWGTLEDNTLEINKVVFYQSLNLFVRVAIELNANINCEIEDGIMTLTGTAEGHGEAQVVLTKLEVTLENGTLAGVLEEVLE